MFDTRHAKNKAPVAQLDRVPGYEPGGREFESLRARQNDKGSRQGPFFVVEGLGLDEKLADLRYLIIEAAPTRFLSVCFRPKADIAIVL
jgi:hypothetical protein